MLFTYFHRFLGGYLKISVSGRYPERFLNVCANRSILLWDVRTRSQNNLTCSISIRGFRMLRPIVKKTHVRVEILEKKGLPVLWMRYKKRKGFLIGILLALGLFIVMNQFIWKIEITGCETLSAKSVLAHLEDCGLRIGAFRPLLNEKEIKNRMLIAMPELSWVWADKRGSKVIVTVKERVPVPEIYDPNAYCHIVAERDGVIDAMVIRHGSPMVTIGDSVKAGDVLVSGLLLSEKGVPPRMVQAEGEIYGRVWYEKTKAFSLWSPIYRETGQRERKVTLHLFGLELKLFSQEETKFSDYEKEVISRELSLFGRYLGLGYRCEIYRERSTTYEKLTEETVVQEGILELERAIEEEVGPDSEKKDLRSSHTVIDEDTLEVTVVAEYIAEIGKKTPGEKEAAE